MKIQSVSGKVSYCLCDTEHRWIKLGEVRIDETKNLESALTSRLTSVQVGCPFALNLYSVDLTHGDNFHHKKLFKHRMRGEWFFFNTEVKSYTSSSPFILSENTSFLDKLNLSTNEHSLSDTLQRIKQLQRKPRNRERLSYGKIARILNKEGYRNRLNNQWTDRSVRKICVKFCWRTPCEDT